MAAVHKQNSGGRQVFVPRDLWIKRQFPNVVGPVATQKETILCLTKYDTFIRWQGDGLEQRVT